MTALTFIVGMLVMSALMSVLTNPTPQPWAHQEAIPGLSTAERREFERLHIKGKKRTDVEEARLAALTAQVDADLAEMGLSPADVPALEALAPS